VENKEADLYYTITILEGIIDEKFMNQAAITMIHHDARRRSSSGLGKVSRTADQESIASEDLRYER